MPFEAADAGTSSPDDRDDDDRVDDHDHEGQADPDVADDHTGKSKTSAALTGALDLTERNVPADDGGE